MHWYGKEGYSVHFNGLFWTPVNISAKDGTQPSGSLQFLRGI